MRPNAEAVVVDEVFAKRYFPNENPLGRRFGLDPKDNNRYEIVGVVGNSRYNSLRGDAYPTVYEPYRPGGHDSLRHPHDDGLRPVSPKPFERPWRLSIRLSR